MGRVEVRPSGATFRAPNFSIEVTTNYSASQQAEVLPETKLKTESPAGYVESNEGASVEELLTRCRAPPDFQRLPAGAARAAGLAVAINSSSRARKRTTASE